MDQGRVIKRRNNDNNTQAVIKRHESVKDDEKKATLSPQISTSDGGKMMLHLPGSSSYMVKQKTHNVSPHLYRFNLPPKTLEEDEYFLSLQNIITRDYFPCVKEIQQRIDKLDGFAEDSKQVAKSSVMEDASKMSLSDFQKKYTSEDNRSFGTLIAKEMNKRRKKHFDQKLIQGSKAKEAGEIEQNKEKRLLGNPSHAENEAAQKALGYIDTRPTALNSWETNDQNALMFVPKGNRSTDTNGGNISPDNTRVPAPAQDNREYNNKEKIVQALNNHTAPQINGYEVVTNNGFKMSGSTSREKLHDALLEEKNRIHKQEREKASNQGSVSKSTPLSSSRRSKLTPAASRLVQKSAGISARQKKFDFNVTPRRTPK